MIETIKVDLTIRLPDINNFDNLPVEYSDYGRFGILTDGAYFFSHIASSHPRNTKYGYYWALNGAKDTIYISARGAVTDLDYADKPLIAYLIKQLRIRCKNVIIKKY